ncbi:phytoene desaturase family protein [Streptomyces sp. NRRL B-24484]|uniref:phytoene desaturase family protein n=1 Tax=Streptomyces sp. NRRL B-24484 TaxID=1463833 RepID=UPI0004C24D02|nr:NAD(P)/FAD-dependent oxidoreductase [Streptomyces sp. NRRL B-24484]
MPDAIVVGAGPNGLVAANILADAGWQVDVLEGQPEPGGAVRSDRGVHPDYVHDVFSSFYPLAAASPAIGALDLERHGLRWSHAPTVLAHPMPDGRCATLHRGAAATCASLASAFGGADAEAWQRLSRLWDDLDPHLVRTLFTPFPPVRSGAAMAARLRAAGGLRALRFLTLPVRRLAQEEFTEPGAGLLLAGCVLHADLMPESVGSTAFGWLMAMLGQQVGWPVPVGGAAALTGALVRRLEALGGRVHCNAPVVEVVVRGGRALGVRTADGQAHPARRAVLADVPAPALYGALVGWEHLPPRMPADLRRFQWDFSTVKIDWALDGPIPWTAPAAAAAGTVHVGADMDELSDYAQQLTTGRLPRRPFLLLGQMTTADPARSPAGTESAWAYTHVPQTITDDLGPDAITGRWDPREAEAMAERIEQQVERFAPGFRTRIAARRILTPPLLQSLDPSLVGGAINGGTTALHQQLVFRPVPGTGRPETPVTGLYLASSSAHPGGGVHGACGANAARAALRSQRLLAGRVLSPGLAAAQRLLSGRREQPN